MHRPIQHLNVMHEITALNAADYLRQTGRVADGAEIDVRELSGGVSNIVLRVEVYGEPPFVIKQCRERLRVVMDWRAPLKRIWTERAALSLLHAILPSGTIPAVLFEDRSEYLFAMTCAPDDAVTWKTHLMAGQVDSTIAASLGTILGTIHTSAPEQPSFRESFADTSLFEELRIDPYYRTVARTDPETAAHIEALIVAMNRPATERTLVLGDFSPKNILVHAGGLILLDFECAHAGDAAFDLGFFLSHLLLKTIRAASIDRQLAAEILNLTHDFWRAYLEQRSVDAAARNELLSRGVRHAAACVLARVDGKSPVEYLEVEQQAVARSFARQALRAGPATWNDLCMILDESIDERMPWRN
jgi:5-methylthioribose kinase